MALVGLTGSGKSTLVQLVPRLYDVTDGAVMVDGQDVREFDLTELRRRVSIAFEDATLFSDTIRNNVLLGAPAEILADPARAQALLELALDTAQAQFAHEMPEGVDTEIGEEGLSLSGGQRQRIALARSIAAQPQILVLDDPLSALDVRTEEMVTARLREVLAGTTTRSWPTARLRWPWPTASPCSRTGGSWTWARTPSCCAARPTTASSSPASRRTGPSSPSWTPA